MRLYLVQKTDADGGSQDRFCVAPDPASAGAMWTAESGGRDPPDSVFELAVAGEVAGPARIVRWFGRELPLVGKPGVRVTP